MTIEHSGRASSVDEDGEATGDRDDQAATVARGDREASVVRTDLDPRTDRGGPGAPAQRADFEATIEAGGYRFRRGAKALVSTGDRVLLVRERHANGAPFWTLPGGGALPDESDPAVIRRELAEELRCECVVGDRVTSFWYAHSSLVDTVSVYAVRECSLLTEPSPVTGEGVLDLRWARPDRLPTTTLPQVRSVVRHGTDG